MMQIEKPQKSGFYKKVCSKLNPNNPNSKIM